MFQGDPFNDKQKQNPIQQEEQQTAEDAQSKAGPSVGNSSDLRPRNAFSSSTSMANTANIGTTSSETSQSPALGLSAASGISTNAFTSPTSTAAPPFKGSSSQSTPFGTPTERGSTTTNGFGQPQQSSLQLEHGQRPTDFHQSTHTPQIATTGHDPMQALKASVAGFIKTTNGTHWSTLPDFVPTREHDPRFDEIGSYQTITRMPAYQHLSLEELRLQDYRCNRKPPTALGPGFSTATKGFDPAPPPDFVPTLDYEPRTCDDLVYQTITCMPQYQHLSTEELRLQDYSNNRKPSTANAEFSAAHSLPFGQPVSIYGAKVQDATLHESTTPILFGSPYYGKQATGELLGQQQPTTAFGQQQPDFAFGQQQPAFPFGQQRTSMFRQTQPTTFQQQHISTIGQQPTSTFGQQPTFVIGQQPTSTIGQQPTSTFGQQPTFVIGQQPTSTFGQQPTVVFGQQPTVVFVQQPTSTFGQQPTSTFGQQPTSTFEQQPTSTFGQPPTSVFGQQQPTTAFGRQQPAFIFGQQSTSTFGQQFASPSGLQSIGHQPTSSFGQSATNTFSTANGTTGLQGTTGGFSKANDRQHQQEQPTNVCTCGKPPLNTRSVFGSSGHSSTGGFGMDYPKVTPAAASTGDVKFGSTSTPKPTFSFNAQQQQACQQPTSGSTTSNTSRPNIVTVSLTLDIDINQPGQPITVRGAANGLSDAFAPVLYSGTLRQHQQPSWPATKSTDSNQLPNTAINEREPHHSNTRYINTDKSNGNTSKFNYTFFGNLPTNINSTKQNDQSHAARPSHGGDNARSVNSRGDVTTKSAIGISTTQQQGDGDSETNASLASLCGDTTTKLTIGTPATQQPQQKQGDGDSNATTFGDMAIDAGYYCYPSLQSLRKMTLNERKNLKELTIGRIGVGKITFDQPVDISHNDLDKLLGYDVVLDSGWVSVYPDDDMKPKQGDGLNVPATVELFSCFIYDKATKMPIRDPRHPQFRNFLEKLHCKSGAGFVSYVSTTGTWKFKINQS